MFYTISYDIPDNNRRIRMAKTLLDFGDRVQDSVFECRMDDARLRCLLRRLERIVIEEDNVRIYTLCSRCETTIRIMGRRNEMKQNKVLIV